MMTKQLQLDTRPVEKKIRVIPPYTLEVEGGVTINIDENNNVTIRGHNKLRVECKDDLDFDAKNIRMNAQEDIWIGSGNNSVIQSPRVDINPEHDSSGYKGKK